MMTKKGFKIDELPPESKRGEGTCGTVVATIFPLTFGEDDKPLAQFRGRPVAIKSFKRSDDYIFEREREVMRNLPRLEGIVRYYFSDEDKENYYLFMQLGAKNLMELGTSYRNEGKNSINMVRGCMKFASTGLMNLHSVGIMHQDIKPDNIILKWEKCYNCFLADFGSSYRIDVDEVPIQLLTTYQYAAPEQLQGVYTDPISEVWNLAVCFIVASIGYLPFPKSVTPDWVYEEITKGRFIRTLKAESPLFRDVAAEDLFLGMLEIDRKYRFTVDEVLNHPFIQETEFEEPLRKRIKARQAQIARSRRSESPSTITRQERSRPSTPSSVTSRTSTQSGLRPQSQNASSTSKATITDQSVPTNPNTRVDNPNRVYAVPKPRLRRSSTTQLQDQLSSSLITPPSPAPRGLASTNIGAQTAYKRKAKALAPADDKTLSSPQKYVDPGLARAKRVSTQSTFTGTGALKAGTPQLSRTPSTLDVNTPYPRKPGENRAKGLTR